MSEESDDPGDDGAADDKAHEHDEAGSDHDGPGDAAGTDHDMVGAEEEPPVCRHGAPRRWLEKPEPYGWRGWFCAADVPADELCLPLFVGRAHQYDRRHRLRWRSRRNR